MAENAGTIDEFGDEYNNNEDDFRTAENFVRQQLVAEKIHKMRAIAAASAKEKKGFSNKDIRRQMVEEAVQTGAAIRREISEGKFEGGTFYAVLTLSLIKDISDVVSLGLLSFFTFWFITPCLFIVFFMQKSLFKRMAFRMFIWPMIVESIPFLINMFPTYTLATIFLKLKTDKRQKELEEQLRQLDKEIKNIK